MNRTRIQRRLGALAVLFALVLILTAVSQGQAPTDRTGVTTNFQYDENGWEVTVNFFGKVYEVSSDDLEPISEPSDPGEDPGEDPQDPGEDPGEDPEDPGEEPGEDPEDPGEDPGEDPEDPGQEPGEDPEDPGEEPGEDPEDPGQEPGEDPEDPGQEPPETYVTIRTGQLMEGTKYETTYYVIKSNKPGPTVFVTGGVHGNETAGYLAAEQVASYKVSSGTLIVLPRANVPAIQQGRRYAVGDPDLNRSFPQTKGETADSALAAAIWDLVLTYSPDWVIDMHEGVDYYKAGTGSVGQTVIYHPTTEGAAVASKVVNTLNSEITESIRKFTLLRYPVKGGLTRSAADLLGAHAMELETSQKQTLNTRVQLQLRMMGIILDELGMTPSDSIPVWNEDQYRGPWPRVLAEGTPYETTMYRIKGSEPGPAVLVVGGLRGGEPSGVEVAKELLDWEIEKGTLYVLPEANKQAVEAGKKYVESGDLNRQFPTVVGEAAKSELAQAIYDAIDDLNIEYVVDLHEEAGFRAAGRPAEGNSIISHPAGADRISALLCELLNNHVDSEAEKFIPLVSPVKTGLVRSTADTLGTKSFYVSTSTEDSLETRKQYARLCVEYLLAHLGMRGTLTQEVILAEGTEFATPMTVIRSANPGPTVMVVGGVRGNDASGPKAADMVKEFSIDAGTLLVLPRANAQAVEQGVAYLSDSGDLNRQFPTSSTDTPKNELAAAIWDALQEYEVDWLLDLQEAAGYRATTSGALGNTLITVHNETTQGMVDSLVAKLNSEVPSAKRFVPLYGPVTGGLVRSSADFLGVNSIFFSTSTNDSLEDRVALNLSAVSHVLTTLGMQAK
ncbi:MAG: succinylglutamate desuccinylase/aspartoacylase family protein [Bacillota bacterium]